MLPTQCALPDQYPSPAEMIEILENCKRIAVVGLSPKSHRDSHKVARYLLNQDYDIIPVNPGQKEILGRPCFKSIDQIPFSVDMANLFLHPSRVAPVVDQAIVKGVRVIWMQLGVVHSESARKAREAGIHVVMNRCIMTQHKKILGQNNYSSPYSF